MSVFIKIYIDLCVFVTSRKMVVSRVRICENRVQINIDIYIYPPYIIVCITSMIPCRVGSVGNVSTSRTVGREFASRPGHTKDHHKNGTNCLPA